MRRSAARCGRGDDACCMAARQKSAVFRIFLPIPQGMGQRRRRALGAAIGSERRTGWCARPVAPLSDALAERWAAPLARQGKMQTGVKLLSLTVVAACGAAGRHRSHLPAPAAPLTPLHRCLRPSAASVLPRLRCLRPRRSLRLPPSRPCTAASGLRAPVSAPLLRRLRPPRFCACANIFRHLIQTKTIIQNMEP